jgi:hypothetical protein
VGNHAIDPFLFAKDSTIYLAAYSEYSYSRHKPSRLKKLYLTFHYRAQVTGVDIIRLGLIVTALNPPLERPLSVAVPRNPANVVVAATSDVHAPQSVLLQHRN